jgi:hypothetical protein
MPWQRLGWVTLRIMSIHHLDRFRLVGDPSDRSVRLTCARGSPHHVRHILNTPPPALHR